MVERAWLDDAHALVVGVSAYVHSARLPAAVSRGAREVAEVLADPHLGGYHREQVRLLLDGEATREAILEELAVLAGRAGPSATVLVYFAGHGGRAADGRGEVHLLPSLADDASPESLAASAISGAELSAALARIAAGRVLVVFDCCHADGLGGVATPRNLVASLPEGYCQGLAAGRGRVVVAAARADERSWLPDPDGASLFTRHLLAALRGGAAGSGGWLRVWDLYEYIQPRVTAQRPDQHPVFRGELTANFPVALSLGGRGEPPPAAAGGHAYHAYLSYADREPDAGWVWGTLVPRLESAGLAIAVSRDVEEPGVFRVVAAERGIQESRRTVVVLSDAYLEDELTGFIDALAQTLGLEEGRARLVPLRFRDFDDRRLPPRLRSLVSLDLGHPRRGQRDFNRLVAALRGE